MKKTAIILMAMALACPITKAEEFRTWTEEATKRKVEAKILEKDDKLGNVTVMLKNLKSLKLEVSKLVKEDQKYIKEWQMAVNPQDQLTIRVVKSGSSRGKRVEVDVTASKSDVVVSGGCNGGGGCSAHSPLKKTVKAGQRGSFQIEVCDKYTFTAKDAEGNLIDQETDLKKTGITRAK